MSLFIPLPTQGRAWTSGRRQGGAVWHGVVTIADLRAWCDVAKAPSPWGRSGRCPASRAEKHLMETENSRNSRFEQANTLGLAYLRSLIALNGGAILALLTFIGNASAQTFVTVPLNSIKCSMTAFLIGIASMLIGLLISYSYTAPAPDSKYKVFWDTKVIALNTFCGLVSLTSFISGVAILIAGAQNTG